MLDSSIIINTESYLIMISWPKWTLVSLSKRTVVNYDSRVTLATTLPK